MIRIEFFTYDGVYSEIVRFEEGTSEVEIGNAFMEWISQFGGWDDAGNEVGE